jgi:hypothetical protein
MPLLTVGYLKGRPGATTTAIGLAAVAAAGTPAVVVECDAAGGDLMRRHRLAERPSLVDLAAAARTAATPDTAPAITGYTQPLRLGNTTVPVVLAPPAAASIHAALAELAGPGAGLLNPPDRLVVADCGRLDATSPARALLATADATVLLCHAHADDLAHLRDQLPALDTPPAKLTIALTASGGYSPAEVTHALTTHLDRHPPGDRHTLAVYGPLPHDPRAAAILRGHLLAGRRWLRLPLMAALQHLLHNLTPPLPTTPTDAASPTEPTR